MSEKILVIAVPVLMPDSIPYGPSVVSGILKKHDYDSSVWDLSIDLFHKYSKDWNVIVDMLGNRAYRPSNQYSLNIRQILGTIRNMLRDRIQQQQPDIILLSVFSMQSLDMVIALSKMLKDIAPHCYTMAGGRGLDNTERTTRLNYAEYFAKYLPIDCWYLGDAENNLINCIKTRHKGVFYSPPVTSQDIENVPPANWNGYDFSKYQESETKKLRMPITGSKGCVRDCTFCDVGGSWPKFVFRKGQDIAKEMIDFYRTTGIKRFEFTDNLINGSIKNFRAMNTYISDHEPNVFDYLAYAICRPKNEFPESDFRLARTAGASKFKVGIESGSESVRYDMKKKFTNEDITWFAENCHDNGIKQIWLMFVGYPTETEKDFQDSIDLLERHKHLTGDGMITVFLSLPMMLTSGSAFMRKYGDEYGLLHNSSDPWSDMFWTSTLYKNNTFDVRLSRWRRFVEATQKYGYDNTTTRQAEKFLEIEGLEKIYKENYENFQKIIPITAGTININKETHI